MGRLNGKYESELAQREVSGTNDLGGTCMSTSSVVRSAFRTILGAVSLAGLVLTVPAQAQTFSVLYNFGTKTGDPNTPASSGIIAQGRDGNLYSTSAAGGANNMGAVFKITPRGTLTVLYSFDGTHGSSPVGGLTLGTDGNFYGTAQQGGTLGRGNFLKIPPAGTLTVLYNFGTQAADGFLPSAPPIEGTDGNFYGTTQNGGTSSKGIVYKITSSGTFTKLYSF